MRGAVSLRGVADTGCCPVSVGAAPAAALLIEGAGEGDLAGWVRNPVPRDASAMLVRRQYDRLWQWSTLSRVG